MRLARVIGTVVARQTVEGLLDKKFLVLEPLNDKLEVTGPSFVAVDAVQAGPDEIVFWVGSREASLGLDPWFVPVDAAIVGIVDAVPSKRIELP